MQSGQPPEIDHFPPPQPRSPPTRCPGSLSCAGWPQARTTLGRAAAARASPPRQPEWFPHIKPGFLIHPFVPRLLKLVAGEKSTTGNAALAKGAVFYLRFWLPRAQILDMDKFFFIYIWISERKCVLDKPIFDSL